MLKANRVSHSPPPHSDVMKDCHTSVTPTATALPRINRGFTSPQPNAGTTAWMLATGPAALATAQAPVSGVDRRVGTRPDRRRRRGFRAGADQPPAPVPGHPLAVRGRDPGGLGEGGVDLEVDATLAKTARFAAADCQRMA